MAGKDARIPQSDHYMVAQLADQLQLLLEFGHQAFGLSRGLYLPDVAGKLRLLVVQSGKNRPLLLDVAVQLGVDIRVAVGHQRGRTPTETVGMDEYLRQSVFTMLDPPESPPTPEQVSPAFNPGAVERPLSREDMILKWSQQLGGVHVDRKVDERLAVSLDVPVRFSSLPFLAYFLKETTEAVLEAGDNVMVAAGGRRPQHT